MDIRISQIEQLLEEGRNFTSSNFCLPRRSPREPEEYGGADTPEWLTWKTRVFNLIQQVALAESSAMKLAQKGIHMRTEGFYLENFEITKSSLIKSLEIVQAALKTDAFNEIRAPATRAPLRPSPRSESQPIKPQSSSPVNPPTSMRTNASTNGSTMPDSKKVFIIHGRNIKARDELGIFIRSLGLSPINFMDLRASMGGTPTVAEIVEKGMEQAQGVIALITADEYAAVRPDFRSSHDQPDDIMRWQARPNVIFEAGMAFGRDRKRVVFVLLGNPKLFTDVAGIHILRPTNDPSGDRAALRTTLSQGMGCDIEPHSSDWMKSGDLVSCISPLLGVSPRDPF